MNKAIAILAGLGIFGAGVTVPLVPVSINCPVAWQDVVYDTPSGKLTDGYYTAQFPFKPHDLITDPKTGTTTQAMLTPIAEAHVIGTSTFADCIDVKGQPITMTMTNTDYANFQKPNAGVLQLTEMVSATDITLSRRPTKILHSPATR